MVFVSKFVDRRTNLKKKKKKESRLVDQMKDLKFKEPK